MLINNNYTTLTRAVSAINNPNLPIGTLIEEIPADAGRSWQGYKRGGIIEGTEKLRKEVMSAVVWMFGIPAFNKAGNFICEKILNIPMNIDFSNAKEGNDAIKNSVEFLTSKNLRKNTSQDVSDLLKYGDKFIGKDAAKLAKKIKIAKQSTSISALIINCAMMGIVLPKFNQKITSEKLKEKTEQNQTPVQNFPKMEEFLSRTKKGENISFTGLPKLNELPGFVTYNIENNNTFRLISTDVPMIGGRTITSRNIYEGLEFIIIDGGSIYFYNFSASHIQKLLRKITSTPEINPVVAELIGKQAQKSPEAFKIALDGLDQNGIKNLSELFNDKDFVKEVYKNATYGKFGKINKFVKDEEIQRIDKEVNNFLKKIKKENSDINKIIKNTNRKNAAFLGIGLGVSILGLSIFIPKLAFKITEMLTGRNEFTGIADYSKDKKET